MVTGRGYLIEYGPIAGSPHCGWWAVNPDDSADYHGPYPDQAGAEDAAYELLYGE